MKHLFTLIAIALLLTSCQGFNERRAKRESERQARESAQAKQADATDPVCAPLRERINYLGKAEADGSMSQADLDAAKLEVQLNPNLQRCRAIWRAEKGGE